MYKDYRIAVVIPAHNEEKFIKNVIKSLPGYIDRIIVIDDCSTDDTCNVVSAINDNRVEIIRNNKNLGVGGSTINGFEKSIRENNVVDIIMKIDGDGQMPVTEIPVFLDTIIEQNFDYVKGNRFIDPISLKNMPCIRLFGNVVLTFLNKLASGYWHVFDPQNGFLAIKSSMYKHLDVHRIYKRYFFENDMLVQLNLHNARVKDIPIETIYGNEKSGVNIFSVICVFPFLFIKRFLYRVYQKYVLRDFSPIALFLFIGIILFSFGVIWGSITWFNSVKYQTYASTGTVMLSVLPVVMGFELLLQAVVLDINNTPK